MRGSVLIVHDDLGVRRSLGEFLATKGHKAITAATAQEALAVLEEDVPLLLVIGVGLPLLSGWKLIEALAHYPDLSRIPRLLVSPGEATELVGHRALAVLHERDLAVAAAEAEIDGNEPDTTPTPEGLLNRRSASA